jgi:hypothetical protein
MRDEELARRVNQHVVQLRLQTTFFGQSEVAAYPIELRKECSLPSGLVDRDSALGNLPRVTDAAIETSLVFETMAGWPCNLAQAAGGARRDRQPDTAQVLNFENEITRRGGPLACERARCADPSELPADIFQYQFHLRTRMDLELGWAIIHRHFQKTETHSYP